MFGSRRIRTYAMWRRSIGVVLHEIICFKQIWTPVLAQIVMSNVPLSVPDESRAIVRWLLAIISVVYAGPATFAKSEVRFHIIITIWTPLLIVLIDLFRLVCSDCDRYNRTCSESGECCPEQCIGGCIISSTNPSNQTCFACKNFIFQNRCYEKCPPNTFLVNINRCYYYYYFIDLV